MESKTWRLHASCLQSVAVEGAASYLERVFTTKGLLNWIYAIKLFPPHWYHQSKSNILTFFFLFFFNQIFRIKRLWTAVNSIYYEVLHYLEQEGFLSIANPTHLFCCHFVFIPRLQNDLDTFRNGWDSHPSEQIATWPQTSCWNCATDITQFKDQIMQRFVQRFWFITLNI